MPSGSTRLIFERPDGGVSVDIPTLRRAGVDADGATIYVDRTAAEVAAHIARIEAEQGVTHRATITMAELRPSRRLRNAWRWIGDKLDVDLPAGRAVLLAELRAARDAKLVATDGEALGAQERGQPDEGLRDYRQALRDLPAAAGAELNTITDSTALENWQATWPVRVG